MGSVGRDREEDIQLHPLSGENEHRNTNGSTIVAEQYAEDMETGEGHGLLHNGKPKPPTQSRRLFTTHGMGKRLAASILGGIGQAALDVVKIPSACRRLGFRGTMRTVFNYPERTGELRSTAWLDGLRGLAAFEVFIFHYMDGWMNHGLAWGSGEQMTNTDPHWYYLPFVRTLFASGDAAVCLFFGISGYVLTLRMLNLLRQQKHEQLMTSLSSAVFRRGIRLYMPVVVETFTLMILCRWFYFPKPAEYPPAETFYLEVRTWYVSFVHLLLPLRYPDRWDKIQDRYDGGISWTIPLEYYGSLFVYMILVLLARVQSIGIRRSLIFAMVFCSFTKDDWIAAQFLLGMAFADYQLERQERLKNQRVISTGGWERWGRPIFFWGLAIFGFYLSGMPGGHLILAWKEDYRIWPRPLFDWILQPIAWTGLYYQRQADRYILCFATMCSLMGFGETPHLRRLLESRLVQYLGRISFGLYLCHIFMRAWLESIGISRATALSIVGLDPTQTYFERLDSDAPRSFLAYLILMIPSTMINFIGAGLFERYLDRPSVKAGRAFEQFCLSWNNKTQNGVIAPPGSVDPAIPMRQIGSHGMEARAI